MIREKSLAGDGISVYHEITNIVKSDTWYHSETWAEVLSAVRGHIKWHSDGRTTFIDMVETDGRTPFLGVRLLKALRDHNNQDIDPGMMNYDGKRLWRLFRMRYYF